MIVVVKKNAANCLNKISRVECDVRKCKFGAKCQNSKFQRHRIESQPFMTANKGGDVRTTKSIEEGTIIFEYVGEVISEKEYLRRKATLYAHDTHNYCASLGKNQIIDSITSAGS